jgi:hypothetical protein
VASDPFHRMLVFAPAFFICLRFWILSCAASVASAMERP